MLDVLVRRARLVHRKSIVSLGGREVGLAGISEPCNAPCTCQRLMINEQTR